MTRTRVLLLLMVCLACPSVARAQGFLDFMEQWSGPGPFNYGPAVDFRLGCQLARQTGGSAGPDARRFVGWFQHDAEEGSAEAAALGAKARRHSCAVRSKDVLTFLDVRYARGSMDDHHPLFSDRQNELLTDHARGINLNANTIEALFMRQIFDPAFAIGFGAGVVWFDGSLIDQSPKRLLLTPLAVDITPLRLFFPNARIARAVVFHFQESAFIFPVRARDFNSTSTSPYEAHAEVFRRFGVNLDIVALAFKE